MGEFETLDDTRLTSVGLLFETAASLRRIFEQRFETENRLSGQSFDVLIRLARTPGHRLRMSELADQASLSPSGLTRAADRLADEGLMTRQVCPEDRRGAFAVLTPKGEELMNRAVPDHIAHIDEVLTGVLTPEEEQVLTELLRRLRDHLHGSGSACGLVADGRCPGA